MPPEEDKQKLIDAILNKLKNLQQEAELNKNLPKDLKERITELKNTSDDILNNNATDISPKELNDINQSIDDVNLQVATFNLATTAKNQGSSYWDDLAKDCLRIGENLNSLLKEKISNTDGSVSSVAKGSAESIWIGMKAVVSSCVGAAVGMGQGIRQGFIKNEGFVDTLGGMVKEASAGALSGAVKGAADALITDDKIKAQKKIDDLRTLNNEEIDLLKNGKYKDNPANQARIEVLEAENKYLDELESKLNDNPSPEEVSDILGSATTLSMMSAGISVLHTGLEVIHDFGSKQKFEGKEGKEALEELGKDALSVAKNFNAVLDNRKMSTSSKVGKLLKAFTVATAEGCIGCIRGAMEGVQQEGLGSTAKGAIYSSFASAAKGFNRIMEEEERYIPYEKARTDKNDTMEGEEEEEEQHIPLEEAHTDKKDTMEGKEEEEERHIPFGKARTDSTSTLDDVKTQGENLAKGNNKPNDQDDGYKPSSLRPGTS